MTKKKGIYCLDYAKYPNDYIDEGEFPMYSNNEAELIGYAMTFYHKGKCNCLEICKCWKQQFILTGEK